MYKYKSCGSCVLMFIYISMNCFVDTLNGSWITEQKIQHSNYKQWIKATEPPPHIGQEHLCVFVLVEGGGGGGGGGGLGGGGGSNNFSLNTQSLMVGTIKNEMTNYSVKPVLSGHSKIDKNVLMANGSLMKVESIAGEHPAILLTCIKR